MIFHPFILVALTVFLGLMSAIILKDTCEKNLSLEIMCLIFIVVFFINTLRFLIWGYIHKRHPVSLSYPYGSVFFPLILLIGHFHYAEPLSIQKLVASIFIMLGVAILTTEGDDNL